jgi:hypothetical protein
LCFVCKSSQYTTVQSKCSRIRTPLVITCFLLGIANIQMQGRGTTFPVRVEEVHGWWTEVLIKLNIVCLLVK